MVQKETKNKQRKFMIIFCSICASDLYLCSHLAILSLKLLPVLFKKKKRKIKEHRKKPLSFRAIFKTVIETLECSFCWMERQNESMYEQKCIPKCKPLPPKAQNFKSFSAPFDFCCLYYLSPGPWPTYTEMPTGRRRT